MSIYCLLNKWNHFYFIRYHSKLLKTVINQPLRSDHSKTQHKKSSLHGHKFSSFKDLLGGVQDTWSKIPMDKCEYVNEILVIYRVEMMER